MLKFHLLKGTVSMVVPNVNDKDRLLANNLGPIGLGIIIVKINHPVRRNADLVDFPDFCFQMKRFASNTCLILNGNFSVRWTNRSIAWYIFVPMNGSCLPITVVLANSSVVIIKSLKSSYWSNNS